ncbi:MamK family actin-like protein [Engelhardtia mirabilis]|uniref:MamK-like protein n=1 Tax=Engelhardtia mirabilis TaxID=2528011 RepID=A0A518BQG5_9BACT|nr:MamK-like protein [Planctomycetes bacterium Pla133]QDV03538.1 MamK-like protein [Planctomycetes bacterium Pla86]
MSTKKSEGGAHKGILYLGIDLGTSRCAVVGSNGIRDAVASYVGYPKDVVSRKALGVDVLFGDKAIEKRMSVELYRPLAKGVLKTSLDDGDDAKNGGGQGVEGNARAAKDLIEEIVRRAKPRPDELVYAVIGVPAEASIKSKEALLDAARSTVEAVMLCSEPFAVAYGMDMLEDALVVDIGAGTIDLCRMHGAMPDEADQLTLNCGGDFVDEKLAERIRKRHPQAQFSMQMIKGLKEKHASVLDPPSPAIVQLPVDGKPTRFDLAEDIRGACLEIVPPIVDGLAKLISSYDPEFQDKLKQRVLLAGGGSQIIGLDAAIEAAMVERLGQGNVVRTEESLYGGAIGALKISSDMPDEFWEQMS